MLYTHIVWDFNGTILDDVDVGMEATNILLRRRGIAPVASRETYYRLFRFPVQDYYTDIGFDFSRESYADVAVEWAVEYRRLMPSAALRPGVRAVLDAFRAAGLPQTVLSASEAGLLREQLAALDVLSYFDTVIGRSDVHATDKVSLARAFAEERRPGRVLMIGDTDHDAACARAAGFSCALIAGGHQSRARLDACACPVYGSFDELLAALRREGTL